MIRDYPHSLAYLQGLMTLEAEHRAPRTGFGARGPSVSRVRCQKLLDRLGNPEKQLQYVHVTGTSGKGSTVALLQSVLVAAGVRVGAYTSPHITTPLERIQLQGRLIPLELWLEGLSRLKPLVDADYRQGPEGIPSYQTLLFALSLWAFARAGVELAIIEVGIGGRLDTTNLIPAPLVALVTEVGLDHTEILGPDIQTIARDKAGIFKPGSHALTLSRRPEALDVLATEAAQVGIPLWQPGVGVQGAQEGGGLRVTTALGTLGGLRVGLSGQHQQDNAVGVVAAAQLLRARGLAISDDAIREGLQTAFLPARCEEVLLPGGVLLLDMAHNADKVAGLVAHWKQRWGRGGAVVVSISHGKDVDAMLQSLASVFDCILLTRPLEVARPMYSPWQLHQRAEALGIDAEVYIDPTDALVRAFSQTARVAVTGSTYLVGEMRRIFASEAEVMGDGMLRPLSSDAVNARVRALMQEGQPGHGGWT